MIRSVDLGSRIPFTNQFRFRVRTCDVVGGFLIDASLAPGRYTALWDGPDARGERAAAGVDCARLATDGHLGTGKFVRLD